MFSHARLGRGFSHSRETPSIYAYEPEVIEGPWWRSAYARLRTDASRRGKGIALALGIELLIVLLLLSLGIGNREEEREFVPVASFDVSDTQTAEEEATPNEPESAAAPAEATPQPLDEPQPVAPSVVPLPSALPVPSVNVPPQPRPEPTPTPTAAPRGRIGAVVRSDRNFGPADTGNRGGPDSERVGTAPDGSALYAAAWYREPEPDQLSGYLSAASGPGWGMIACRTARDWRVEDCEIVSEYPQNSGIARAVQAAAWQFKVRPPRLGGQYQVGSWVRIRIDYNNALRRGGA